MPKLKVFQAHLGFFDTVVAAPSQKAALQAWGSRQNLFHDRAAAMASDPQAISAALEKPGVVLKRLAGSKGAFLEQPPLPNSPGPSPKRKSAPHRVEVSQKKPDRSKLDAAERALATFKGERERMREEFSQREDALRDEKRAHEREFSRRETELEQQLEKAKKEFRGAVRN